MFVPEIKVYGGLLYFTQLSSEYPEEQGIDLKIGNILNFEQHVQTVYVKGENMGVIIVNVGNVSAMKVLHAHSHEIPTWMKEEFDRFMQT